MKKFLITAASAMMLISGGAQAATVTSCSGSVYVQSGSNALVCQVGVTFDCVGDAGRAQYITQFSGYFNDYTSHTFSLAQQACSKFTRSVCNNPLNHFRAPLGCVKANTKDVITGENLIPTLLPETEPPAEEADSSLAGGCGTGYRYIYRSRFPGDTTPELVACDNGDSGL
jgi:hypothetical protein